MLNARRTNADSLERIFESSINQRFAKPQISLRDGETREANDPAGRGHPQVPNLLLKKLQDVYVREVTGGRDPRSSEELRELMECPISQHPMQEPVVEVYGHHFNATHLKKWIDRGNRRAPTRSEDYRGETLPVVVDQRLVRLLKVLDLPVSVERVPRSPWPLPSTMRAPELIEASREDYPELDNDAAARQAAGCVLSVTVGTLACMGMGVGPQFGAPMMVLAMGAMACVRDTFNDLTAWAERQGARTAGSLASSSP